MCWKRGWGDEPLGLAIKRNKANIYAGFVHIDTRGKKESKVGICLNGIF